MKTVLPVPAYAVISFTWAEGVYSRVVAVVAAAIHYNFCQFSHR